MSVDQKYVDEERAARIAQVSAKTQALIEKGFDFDNAPSKFPCSDSDQLKYLSLKSLSQEFTWPVTLSLFEGEYTLQLNNLESFILTALAHVQSYKDSGRALRLQLEAATTLDEMINIVDDRT